MTESKHRFEEIMTEIDELVEEAFELLPEHEKIRAESYWKAHILTSVRKDTMFVSGSMCCMEDSLEAFDEEDCDE